MNKLSIVIPAHNEEGRIGKTLDNYLKYFKELKKMKILNFELIVVLNGCKDKTNKVVNKFRKKFRELRILEFEDSGKGFAIIEGFKYSLKRKNDLIGFVDADMSTPPESFHNLVKAIEHFGKVKNIGGAIANRRDKNSLFEYSRFKKIRSWTYNLISRALFLFPYKDTQCGAKVFKTDILKKVINKLVSSNFNFDIALLFCLKKEVDAKIISVPTIWKDQERTKINLVVSPLRMLLSSIRLRLMHSPFKFAVRGYRTLPKFLQIDYILMLTDNTPVTHSS